MASVISVVNKYTGQTMHLPQKLARDQIEQGTAVETVPIDAAAADQWRADLRARLFAEAVERGNEADIAPFREYEAWCAKHGLHALPVRVEDVTWYLLSLMRDGEPRYEGTVKAYALERMHVLAVHPPRDLSKQVLNSLFRALEFAKLKMTAKQGLTEEIDQAAARKALDMFPAGIVPKRYSEVV